MTPQTPDPLPGARYVSASDAKGHGLAANLIKRSMNSLLDEGYTRLCLAVTEGNAPAQHVYEALGFCVIESWMSGEME